MTLRDRRGNPAGRLDAFPRVAFRDANGPGLVRAGDRAPPGVPVMIAGRPLHPDRSIAGHAGLAAWCAPGRSRTADARLVGRADGEAGSAGRQAVESTGDP